MKKSNIAMLAVCLVLIPATLFLGMQLPGRSYYITGTAIMIELMIPFFMAFEGRRPQARELVVIAVLCALAIVGRVAIPLPYFKAIFAVIIVSGIAFGPESGFMVGAVSALVSNFFYGQGPYTPWQMLAYGVAGMLAGFAFRPGKGDPKPWDMAGFGFLTVLFAVGPLLDCSGLFLIPVELTLDRAIVVLATGLVYVNLIQAACTAVSLLVFGKPLLDLLNRIKRKYGILGDRNAL